MDVFSLTPLDNKFHKRLDSFLPKRFTAPCLIIKGGNYKGSITLPHNLTPSFSENNRKKTGRREEICIQNHTDLCMGACHFISVSLPILKLIFIYC